MGIQIRVISIQVTWMETCFQVLQHVDLPPWVSIVYGYHVYDQLVGCTHHINGCCWII